MERIDWSNYGELQRIFDQRTEILRFAALPTFLIEYKYEYEINDGALYIQRKGKMYGRTFHFMMFPPLTYDNDINREKELLENLLPQVDVILSEEEIKRFKLDKAKYSIKLRSTEFLYPLNHYLELNGKRGHSWRQSLKSVDRDFETRYLFSEDIQVDKMYSGLLRQSIYPELLNLTAKWLEINKTYSGVNTFIDDFFAGNLRDACLMFLRAEGKVQYYKITQKLSRNTVFMCDAKSLIRNVRYNVNKAALMKIARCWNNESNNQVFNIGMSFDKGMTYSKKLLQPETLRLYRVGKKRG